MCVSPQHKAFKLLMDWADHFGLFAEESSRAELFHKQSGTDERTESYSIFLRWARAYFKTSCKFE